ncbi:flippase [bacterium]|nr:flippase [bacterium]MBU1995141.1 flippase [bacterium]
MHSNQKTLTSNFLSLSSLQIVNYILPFITLPYLIRVLGVEYFGLLAFATATVTYFGIITDYGFNLSATREISIHREDKEKIIEIFSSVMMIKVMLMLLSFLLLLLLVFSFEKFSQDWEIYLLTFSVVVGQVLFPVWFFQGMESMKYTTYLNIMSRIIFTVAIFIFVQEKNDYYFVPVLTSLGAFIAGFWSLILVKKNFGIVFKIQSAETLMYYLREGWYIFISGIFTTVYTVSTLFILGIFGTNQIVGYYALADKIVKAVAGLYRPVDGAIFPYVSKLVKNSKEHALKFIRKIFIYSSIIMGFFSLLVFVYAEEIILLLSNGGYEESVLILKLLAIFPLVITVAKIFSMNYIINFHLQNELSKIYFYSALVSLILSFSLVPMFLAVGSAIAVMLTEIFATAYMYFIIRRKILHA